MRRAIIWAAGLAALLPATAGSTTTDAIRTGTGPAVTESQEWCGFSAHDKSIIECGYSSIGACESATGKDGSCFLDPEYAQNLTHATPLSKARPATGKADTRRS